MKLLVMGRSVNESRDAPHRYRLCANSYAPKFSLRGKQARVEARKMPVGHRLPIEQLEKPRNGSTPLPSPQPAVIQSKVAKVSPAIRSPRFQWKELASLLKAFSFRVLGRGSRPRANPGQLQAELSMDAVKVIRNDLNDADLEVVEVKKGKSLLQRDLVPRMSGLNPAAMKEKATASAFGKTATRVLAALHL